jgi:hypothetical protein
VEDAARGKKRRRGSSSDRSGHQRESELRRALVRKRRKQKR